MSKGNKNPKTEHLKKFQYQTEGKYRGLSSKPVSVKFPPELDQYIRSLPNRNQWIIEAALEKMMKETLDASSNTAIE